MHSTFLLDMSYQAAKAKDFGINLCEGCLQKQLIINRQNQEILALKKKLQLNERRLEAVFKILYLALRNISKKWTMPIKNWAAAMNQFAILFPDRVPLQ